jgi:hypothetical protein
VVEMARSPKVDLIATRYVEPSSTCSCIEGVSTNEAIKQTTLEYTCKCKNGTEPDMTLYQQSVPAQMCLYWYGQCINATNENKQQQLACVAERDSRCGNLTIDDQGAVSTTTREGSPTSTGGGGGSSGTAGAATGTGAPSESSGAAIALHVARDYGTPILGAGIMAIFGLAL